MSYRKFGTVAVGLIAASTLAACGPDAKNGEPVSVSHQDVSQSVEANTLSVAASLSASLEMLEDSKLFADAVEMSAGGDDVACADFNDPGVECSTEPEPIELDSTIDEGSDALVKVLRESIFTDANIETEATTEVVYLLRGDVLCESLSGETGVAVGGGSTEPAPIEGSADVEGDVVVEEDLTECIDAVDAAEIRLRVTAPAPGDVTVAVLVGPDLYNPASFDFHRDLLAAELDLAGAKSSIEHIASALGEEAPELPTRMAGRVRGELKANGPESISTTFSILTPIDIAHTQFSLQAAAASPAAQMTIDGATKQIESLTNFGAIDLSFVDETYTETVDSQGNFTEDVTQNDYDLHIAGITGSVLFNVASSNINLTGLGLGNGTTTLGVDGQQVLSIDVNANSGRTFDATIKQAGADDVEIAVSPEFDLRLGLDFQNAPDMDADTWAQNEVMTILLDGDANPAILAGENGLEVLRGKLTMGLANDGAMVEVNAGQCLIGSDSETTEPVEPVESAPFDGLEAGTCG